MVGVVIDDAIIVLENVFRVIEEKGLPPQAGGDRGHARNRPGRAGHDALAGDRVSAGVVSVERHGAAAVRVRHHGQRGGHDLDARQLLAHADDVQPHAAARPKPRQRPTTADASPPRAAASTAGSKAATCVCLRLVDAASLGGAAAVSLAVIAANVPLYQLVKQDYIPTDVDEVGVRGPHLRARGRQHRVDGGDDRRGRAAGPRDSRRRARADDRRRRRGRAASSAASMYVRLDDIESAHVLAGAGCGDGAAAPAIRGRRSRATSTSATRCARSASIIAPVSRAAGVGPQSHVVPPGRAGRYRLRGHRARPRRRSPSSANSCATSVAEMPGHRRRRLHAPHGQAEPAGPHRPRAGRGAGRRRPGNRRHAARRRRRRRPRLALLRRRRPTTPTTSSCGWWASTAAIRSRSRSSTCARCGPPPTPARPRRSKPPAMPLISGLGYDGSSSAAHAARQRRHVRGNVQPVAHRPARPPADGGHPRQSGAGLRAGRPRRRPCSRRPTSSACRPATRRACMGGARELETHARRVRVDLRPVVRLHVHRARRAVRASRPPDHDSALAADRRAVRPVQPVARRRNAQPLLGPGHPRAVRHGEEGVDPAGRSHQPAPRRRACRATRRSCKATATACGRS